MSIYMEASNGDRFFLDATVELTYSQTGSPTQYAVESGVDSTDHYSQEPDTISYSGQISKVKFLKNAEVNTDLETFEKGITALKKSGQFFSVSFSDNLSVMRNCLFTNLQMTRNTETGRYAMNVSFSIQQVIVAAQAQLATTPTPANQYVDVVETGKTGGGNTQTPDASENRKLQDIAVTLDKTGVLKNVFPTATVIE